MFNKESKMSRTTEINILAKNTTINGDIVSEGDFRIDGILDGILKTKGRVIIGQEGVIKGVVVCNNADIEGKFTGELTVNNLLTIKSTANISGDVVIGKLYVEPGAYFNVTCSMKGSIKELNKEEKQKSSEKTA